MLQSFFGRTYNNLGSISECKNNGKCVITKKNRTSCKACRLRKCLVVGMSKSGSRYGRRSNWFKIHCLLQEQQQNQLPMVTTKGKGWEGLPFHGKSIYGSMDLDNNNSTSVKDVQERCSVSPMMVHPGYSSMETAAALWAARNSLLPVHPHPPGLPFFPPPPFLQSPPFPHPAPANFSLLPFMSLRPPPPDALSTTPLSEASSSSSPRSSPTEGRHKPVACAKETMSYDNSLAVFRALGPVQDTPMDLSCGNSKLSAVKGSAVTEGALQDQNSNIVGIPGNNGGGSSEISGDVCRRTPLDLTCSKL